MTRTGPVQVTVVIARGCHFCQDARRALAELGRLYPLAVEELAAGSPVGKALVLEQGTGLFPLVLVEGEFFSAGRLPRRKLAALLAEQRPALAGMR